MFNVVEQSKAKEIEASARMRGAFDKFLDNVTEFHKEWSEDNEGTFLLDLTSEGAPFEGKKPDSLYTGLQQRITKRELKDEWRLIKNDGTIYLAHL